LISLDKAEYQAATFEKKYNKSKTYIRELEEQVMEQNEKIQGLKLKQTQEDYANMLGGNVDGDNFDELGQLD
jgi:hypothetical protein